MTEPVGADLILEWCSVKGEGTRHGFDEACKVVLGDATRPARLLHELELCGHVEVDWVRTGRWSINPPVLSQIEGAGGNAVLIGARSRSTIAALARLDAVEKFAAFTQVQQGVASPTAVFVAATSVESLGAAASAIGATAKTTVRLEYKDALLTLDDAIAAGADEYTASGIQARRLNVSTFRFEPCEIRFGTWRPGCYEQMSYGLRRYLYVDDDGALHNLERWLAVHAEINRSRRRGVNVAVPLSWAPKSESLFCDARAQLPIMWARAAVMCSGLLPIRHVAPDGHHVDEYRGVLASTYNTIRKTLGYPSQLAAPEKKASDAHA